MRIFRIFITGPALLLALGLVTWSLKGCGQGSQVQPITLLLQYQPAASSFTSATGWKISVSEASLDFMVLRFNEGKQAYSMNLPHLRPILARWLSPWQEAWAHPGHYQEGSVKAEMIYPPAFSLIGPKVFDLGVMHAFTGIYGTAEIEFHERNRIKIKGIAEKNAHSIPFAFDIPMLSKSVKGIPIKQEITKESLPLTLRMHLEKWFDYVDFLHFVKPVSGGESILAQPDTTTTNILQKAVLQTSHYSFPPTISLPPATFVKENMP